MIERNDIGWAVYACLMGLVAAILIITMYRDVDDGWTGTTTHGHLTERSGRR